jgi:catechol 1,2-dioxygenase
VQFGVTEALVGNYIRHDTDKAPDVKAPWYSLDYTFTIEKGEAKLPKAPITAKAEKERSKLEVLERV